MSIGMIVFGFFGMRKEIFIFWKATFLHQKRKIFDPFNTTGMSNPDTTSNVKSTNNRSNISLGGGEKEIDLAD